VKRPVVALLSAWIARGPYVQPTASDEALTRDEVLTFLTR
jgi:hypothetical protein